MKKLSSLILTSAILVTSGTVFAAPQAFNDVYTFNGGNVLKYQVISGKLSIKKLAANQILLTEPEGYEDGGVFKISAGADSAHQCTLIIQDVDFEIPKLINESCTGGYSVASFNAGYNDITIDLKS